MRGTLAKMILSIAAAAALSMAAWPSVSESRSHQVAEPQQGTGWFIYTVNCSNSTGWVTSIDVDSLGYPHILYSSAADNLRYARWNGHDWSCETIEPAVHVGHDKSIAIDKDDHVHISYFDKTNHRLRYGWNDGTTWNISTVYSYYDFGWYSSIAADRNGYPHIGFSNAGQDLRYARWNGTAWNVSIVDSEQYVGTGTYIALDSEDYPHFTYLNGQNMLVKYAKWNGTAWSNETVNGTNHYHGAAPIALDSLDRPHFSFISFPGGATRPSLIHVRWNGTAWVFETADTAPETGYYSSIAVDSLDRPQISYFDGLNRVLKYASWTGTNWSNEIVDSGDNLTTAVGYFTYLALDASDAPHISYIDATNWRLKYASRVPLEPVNNPPVPEAGPDLSIPEGQAATLDGGGSYDPDGDSLQYRWDFEDDGVWDTPWSLSPYESHVWGDDYRGTFALQVSDGNLTAIDRARVTVINIPPSITQDIAAGVTGNLTLRIAGEKWHDISLTVFRDGMAVANASVTRTPGSPDDQAVTIGNLTIDMLEQNLAALVAYTPDDDPINGQPNGANPAWLVFTAEDGNESRLHHTFNTRHTETWIWKVDDLRIILAGMNVTFTATATDPGSDDLTFTWDWGDGSPTATTARYNNAIGPDPYPSPEVNPITVTDVVKHIYHAAGDYQVTLKIMDDDGGMCESVFLIGIG